MLFILSNTLEAESHHEYSNLNDFLDEVSNLYTPDLSVTVIVRGVGERGYRVSVGETTSGQRCLIAEIPTYVGRGNDLYCAALDHLFGYKGRGRRILNGLEKLQGKLGHIDNLIMHSGAVAAIKNVSGSKKFHSVLQKGKIGKVAFAGAYVDSELGKAMDNSGIPWKALANKGDLVVAITKTNLQTLGFSGKPDFRPIDLLIFPVKTTGWFFGGALKMPQLMFFKSGLDPHPLAMYGGDIASWLGDKAPKRLSEKHKKKGKRTGKSKKDDKSSPSPYGDGGNGGGGGGSSGPSNGGSDAAGNGNSQRMSFSGALSQGQLKCEIGASPSGSSVILNMEKGTDQPLNLFIPAGTVLESNQGGVQNVGM